MERFAFCGFELCAFMFDLFYPHKVDELADPAVKGFLLGQADAEGIP